MDRNLNPHKSARIAMLLYHDEYAAQRGGSLDFWDGLTESQRRNCRERLREIELAPDEF